MYNYNHLYYFYVTARSGVVTSAAAHLGVSQPSLSSQLKVLESSLELKLFKKVGRNNVLTPAGSVIYGFCRRMFELSEEMEESISKRVPSANRRIHIGVSEEVDRPFVVEVVSLFLKKHGRDQRPKVTVTSGDDQQLSDRLKFREIDAIVTELAMTDPELSNLQSAEVPVALTCSSKWALVPESRSLKVGAVLNKIMAGEAAQWIMPSYKSKLRSEIDRFFEENNLKGRIVFESDVVASLVRSVIDEIGFAFLPLLYIAREIREKSVQVLGPSNGYWNYKVWLVCHHQNRNDALIRSLADSFKEVCEQSARLTDLRR